MAPHLDPQIVGAEDTSAIDVTSSFSLLLRARGGDEAARDELCARYLPRLRRWAHGRLPVWAREHLDTEDIVQDALMKSFQRLDSFTPEHEGAFCAYVCQALRNRVRDALRRAARRPAGRPLSVDEPATIRRRSSRRSAASCSTDTTTHCSGCANPSASSSIARVELGLDYAEIAGLSGRTTLAAARVAVEPGALRLAAEMGHDRRA